ncbi:MAG: AAA family ATPase [Eubacteriales bacterium]|nr:AAA family ATPase [Eubacteriales bacterium]
MDKYIGTTEASKLLHITARRVVGLCRSGEIEGAILDGKRWKVPESAVLELAMHRGVSADDRRAAPQIKPCAVGNTSYVSVVRDCYYVDKTLLIRELIDDHNMVTLFTRPRRFGKTLALSMLKTFFELSDEDTSVYFKDKAIWNCGSMYRELQSAFPVIFLTLKDIKYDTWEESREAIYIILKEEYARHKELENSEMLDDISRSYYRRMLRGELSDVEYSRALLNLTAMLSRHYRHQVIILIDEYDTPIQQGFMKGFYEEVISFMRILLSGGLKDNESLAFGVLTGILRVSKENLFSGLNNLVVNTVLDEKYSSYFGFTGEEVLAMAEYYGKKDRVYELREWYNGYRFGSMEIFNPWSVSCYFNNDCVPRNFWVNTSDNGIMSEIMRSMTQDTAEELLQLMQGNRVSTQIDTEVIYPRISDGADDIFSFLLLSGYLTPEKTPEETETGTYAELRIPNMEIRRVYNAEILTWVREIAGSGVVTQVEKSIYLNDPDRLQKALRDYMINCISCFDGAAEGFYHGMVLGLIASMTARYYIRSNRESGDGRFDIQLEPKQKALPGIIMEFKTAKADEKNNLAAMAEEALDQITDRAYESDMRERGVIKIVCYGIAFAGKQVEVHVKRI